VRKKIGISFVVLFAVSLAIAAYLIKKDKKVVVVDPWLAVPSDAVFIIETPDFPELLTKVTDRNGLIYRLGGMRWAADIVESAELIDSITGGREVRELMTGRKVLLSFHVVGQGKVVPMAVMNIGTSINLRNVGQLMTRMGATSSDVREFGEARALSASFGKGQGRKTIHIALMSGIVIVSSSEILIANAVNNKNAGSDIRHQQGFAPVVEASGKDMENIFVLFRNVPRLAQGVVRPAHIVPLSSLAIAAGGDITAQEEGVFISGFLTTAGAGVGVDRLKTIVPAEAGVHEVLPLGTLSYRTIMRRASLSGESALDPAEINATDIAIALSPFTGTEVTAALVRGDTTFEKVILFKMTDRQAAEMILKSKLTAKYKSMRLREDHFMTATGNGSGEPGIIYKIPFAGVASVLSGAQGSSPNDDWVTFCRSYMIFASGPEVLADIRRLSDSDDTMINDPLFREMEKTLPTKSSFMFYSTGEAISGILDEFITPEAASVINEKTFSGLEGIGISLSPSDGMIYTSLSFRYRDASAPEVVSSVDSSAGDAEKSFPSTTSDLVWKVKLMAGLTVKPFLFKNHNTDATEVFVQDMQNNIYLISAGGKILWSAKIREEIRGDIFMIDYYRNGKNQILFAGREYIHLIDRNGNYVDKFPIKLKSPASNSLALFDYEGNKDYRLCIAGEDKKIYVYDRSGIPVRGWNLFTTKGKVSVPVSFFRVKGKDYIAVTDEQTIYLLDRTGNIRVNVKEQVTRGKKSALGLSNGTNPALVCISPDGTIVNILFDGTVSKLNLEKFTPHHSFEILDLDSDGADEYIFIDQGQLSVYNSDKKKLFSRSFETNDLSGPYKYIFSNSDKRLGVYENGRKQIYLLSRNGVSVAGFPRAGGPWFTVGKFTGRSSWNFIMDGTDGYLYNYEINVGLNR